MINNAPRWESMTRGGAWIITFVRPDNWNAMSPQLYYEMKKIVMKL